MKKIPSMPPSGHPKRRLSSGVQSVDASDQAPFHLVLAWGFLIFTNFTEFPLSTSTSKTSRRQYTWFGTNEDASRTISKGPVEHVIKKAASLEEHNVAQRISGSKSSWPKRISVHGQPVRIDNASPASPPTIASYDPHAFANPFSIIVAQSCMRCVTQKASCV
eukprot:CAMPEP_0172924432 /NCGR_PEP_ID=MMETSP1075-20121228/211731_1 /TAXON_ID=2916 /ORGANISM="Ceratium fusus, Strain PA161109" /LENGTH=162 /DNA_ID=CAMNT_0013785093 /DNA_START=819 /DNA_END=1307 /DNA_ORIENTATION=+